MNAKVTVAKLAPVQIKATPEERYDRWIVSINRLKVIKQDLTLNQEKHDSRKVETKVQQLADYWLP
jgi:hypothetical protein